MNTYRVAATPPNWPESLPFRLRPIGHEADYGVGETFEHEFANPEDELANITSGLLEIVPRDYVVTGESRVFDTDPGDTFTTALTMGQETHLIGGGFVERVKAPALTTPKRTTKKKGDMS